jgi:hypothetical protein
MTQTYDEMMKVLEEKGSIAEEDGAKLIKEHGPLTDEEKKNLAAAIKMKKALTKPAEVKKEEAKDGGKPDEKKEEKKDEKKEEKPADEKKGETDEVSMDDYLQALSVLDSEDASKEDKEKAQKAKDKFEGS